MKSREEQKEVLLSKIGNQSRCTFPRGENGLKGMLKDRFVKFCGEKGNIVYWNIIDLLDYQGYKMIRFTYYRYKKKEDKWNYSGQNTFMETPEKLAVFFSEATEEKQWFRKVIAKVCKSI